MHTTRFPPSRTCRAFWTICLAAVIAAPTARVAASEWLQIVVPLEEGRFYSASELGRQLEKSLPSQGARQQNDDRRLELTAAERAVLLLAAEMGWLKVEFQQNQLRLWLPNNEDPKIRLLHRRRLSRWLNLPLERWPAGMGLHLPDPFNPDARSVLLIHGLESDASALDRMASACQSAGVQVLKFDYPNDGPVAWSGDRLSEELRLLITTHAKFRTAVIGHSMGGVVARYCVETPGKNPGCVTDLVLLGTPNQGAELAQLQDCLEIAHGLAPGGPGSKARLLDGLGEAGEDLRPGSAFLNELNARPRAPGIRYYVGIGRRSLISDQLRTSLSRQLAVRSQSNQSTLLRHWLQLSQSDALQDGKGDGAVSIASARLEGATDQRLFDSDHLGLLYLPGTKPQEHAVFQWIARQLRWVKE